MLITELFKERKLGDSKQDAVAQTALQLHNKELPVYFGPCSFQSPPALSLIFCTSIGVWREKQIPCNGVNSFNPSNSLAQVPRYMEQDV